MLTNKCEYKPPACILQTVNLYEYKSEEILHLEHQYQLTLLNDFKKKKKWHAKLPLYKKHNKTTPNCFSVMKTFQMLHLNA